jgi:hypothetical protein
MCDLVEQARAVRMRSPRSIVAHAVHRAATG